jgi:hypothetical protein
VTQFPPPPQAPPPPPHYNQPPVSDYPVQVNFVRPQRQSRLLALFSIPYFLIRVIALIPHFIALYFVSIVGVLAVWFGFWAVLFTAATPRACTTSAPGSCVGRPGSPPTRSA